MAPDPLPLRIVDLDVLDPAQEALLAAAVAIHNAGQRARWGERGARLHSVEGIRALARDEGDDHLDLLALDADGDPVGWAALVVPLRDNPELMFLRLNVHPDRLRRGVGSALLAAVEDRARHLDRTMVVSSVVPVGTADPADGFGPRHGYVVAQENQRNTLRLQHDDATLRRWRELRDGSPTAEPAYRIEAALDEPPESWWAGMAVQWRRLSTDAPAGDVPYGEEDWDAARVRDKAARALASGAHLAWAAAFAEGGEGTDEMVALTEIETNPADPASAQQEITLVLREHRGHGLGLRVKAANALQLAERLPEVELVWTWNATDNAPMIAVNRLLGWETTGVARQWTKRVSPLNPR